MAKISFKIPDLRACSEKDLTFAINILVTELRRKQDAATKNLLCKHCNHEIKRGVYGAWLHTGKTIPSNFSQRKATNIITCFCGCHNPEPKEAKKENG